MRFYKKKHIKRKPVWALQIGVETSFYENKDFPRSEIINQAYISVLENIINGIEYTVRNSKGHRLCVEHRIVRHDMKIEIYSINTGELEYELGFE